MTNIIGYITNNVSHSSGYWIDVHATAFGFRWRGNLAPIRQCRLRQLKAAITMLEPLLGSTNAERVLIFLLARGEGYAREIALFFETDLYGIQKQMDKLEVGGVLTSRKLGRTRLYVFNPRYPFLTELKNLLEKALPFYPETMRLDLTMNRRRPRRKGKPEAQDTQ